MESRTTNKQTKTKKQANKQKTKKLSTQIFFLIIVAFYTLQKYKQKGA